MRKTNFDRTFGDTYKDDHQQETSLQKYKPSCPLIFEGLQRTRMNIPMGFPESDGLRTTTGRLGVEGVQVYSGGKQSTIKSSI